MALLFSFRPPVLAGALVAIGAAYGGSLVFDYEFNVESLSGSTCGTRLRSVRCRAARSRPRPTSRPW
jgi:hypothetical protein